MSNQSPQNLELPDLSDLKPLQDQNLNGVDASNVKVPKYYNYFASKLKEKYTFYTDPINLPTLSAPIPSDLRPMKRLRALRSVSEPEPSVAKPHSAW